MALHTLQFVPVFSDRAESCLTQAERIRGRTASSLLLPAIPEIIEVRVVGPVESHCRLHTTGAILERYLHELVVHSLPHDQRGLHRWERLAADPAQQQLHLAETRLRLDRELVDLATYHLE